MKYTKLVIGVMLMASAAAASATTYNLGVLNLDDTNGFNADIVGTKGASFLDTYNFQLSSNADFDGFASSTWGGRSTGTGLNITTFDLYQGTHLIVSGSTGGLYNSKGQKIPGSSASIEALPGLSTGSYALMIGGSIMGTSGKGSYAGTVNVSPVPEPETWGLTLSGLAAVAFMARRRKSSRQTSL
jgi:hypothetical protein